MKPLFMPALAVLAAFLGGALRAERQSGGRFVVEAGVVPAGGHAATGGRFAVQATVGQPLAEENKAGRFELAAGFWTPITVEQVVDAPRLSITVLADGLVRLSWTAQKATFVVEGTTDLAVDAWMDVPVKVTTADGISSLVVSSADPMRCYRLRKQP